MYWLDPENDQGPFPPVEFALSEPDGLLAAGGSLAPARLINAYRRGIFPWYSDNQPILWWSPDPRSVLFPDKLKISRSLRKSIRKGVFRLTMDEAFEQVIKACAEPRSYQADTWITAEMSAAYMRLHRLGVAHSVEAWNGDVLAGGLYGLGIGRVFFGESMFSRQTDASKTALVYLAQRLQTWGYGLIDCQVRSEHMDRLGAESIARARFVRLLDKFCVQSGHPAPWAAEHSVNTSTGA